MKMILDAGIVLFSFDLTLNQFHHIPIFCFVLSNPASGDQLLCERLSLD